jgi:hypothetical protein
MVNVYPFGLFRVAGPFLCILGLTACSPTVKLEGSSGSGASNSSGPTASDGTAGTAGTGAGGHSQANCPVQTLATGLDYRSPSIAYANQYVYYHAYNPNGTDILRVPIAGGAPEVFLKDVPTIIPGSESLAANATDLYWTSGDGNVRKASLDTGVVTVLSSMICGTATPDCLWSMALDDTYVYFGTNDGAIGRVPLGGGSAALLVGGQSTSGQVLALRVDPTSLIWINSGKIDDGGFVMKIPLDGGDPTVLLPAPLDPSGLALRGDYAYVTNYGMGPTGGPDVFMGTGTIYKVRIDQSEPPVMLATGEPGPVGIFADATGVYWGGGRASDGGPPPAARVPIEHLAENATMSETLVPATIAFNLIPCEGAICWVDAATGDLMRYAECNP